MQADTDDGKQDSPCAPPMMLTHNHSMASRGWLSWRWLMIKGTHPHSSHTHTHTRTPRGSLCGPLLGSRKAARTLIHTHTHSSATAAAVNSRTTMTVLSPQLLLGQQCSECKPNQAGVACKGAGTTTCHAVIRTTRTTSARRRPNPRTRGPAPHACAVSVY